MKHKWVFLLALLFQLPMVAQDDLIIRHSYDTLIRPVTDTVVTIVAVPDSVAKQREEIIKTDSTDRRGHYIEAHLGLGYGSLGYSLSGAANRVNGSFSGLVQLQYAYFFHQNFGIGAGLWFTNYTSIAHIGGNYTWTQYANGNPLKDSDTEQNYYHTASVHKWRERETLHNIGIPISLQFQYKEDDWKGRIFMALGIAPSFSVSKKYRVLEGEIAHSAYYPAWNLTLENMHEFVTKDYRNAPESKGELSVRPQVAVFADFGALLPATPQIDVFVGGYFNIIANDANSSTRRDIGWRDTQFDFMEQYAGAYATKNASASHPFEVGLKVGIHWHYIKPDQHKTVDYFEYFTRQDTTVKTIARCDTVVTERIEPIVTEEVKPEEMDIEQVAAEVEKLNKIYFALDSYQLTNKAKRYLSSIVDILNNAPDAKIAIDGHASVEGDPTHNDILSQNRANSVYRYLLRAGLKAERVVVLGHGSRIPNEDTEREELKRDRRVEIKVIRENNESK
jgi:outer membrane protein OmpA-like peptidoglycan-associated protein